MATLALPSPLSESAQRGQADAIASYIKQLNNQTEMLAGLQPSLAAQSGLQPSAAGGYELGEPTPSQQAYNNLLQGANDQLQFGQAMQRQKLNELGYTLDEYGNVSLDPNSLVGQKNSLLAQQLGMTANQINQLNTTSPALSQFAQAEIGQAGATLPYAGNLARESLANSSMLLPQEVGYLSGQLVEGNALTNLNLARMNTQNNQLGVTGEQQQTDLDFLKRSRAAMAGQLPTDPTLDREYDKREQILRNTMYKQLGPGWETSSAGIEALGNLARDRADAIYNSNTEQIYKSAAAAIPGQQLQQFNIPTRSNVAGDISNLNTRAGTMSEMLNRGAANTGNMVNQTALNAAALNTGSQVENPFSSMAGVVAASSLGQPFVAEGAPTKMMENQKSAATFGQLNIPAFATLQEMYNPIQNRDLTERDAAAKIDLGNTANKTEATKVGQSSPGNRLLGEIGTAVGKGAGSALGEAAGDFFKSLF